MAIINKQPEIFAINEKGEKTKIGEITEWSIENDYYLSVPKSIEAKGTINDLSAFMKTFAVGIDLSKSKLTVDMPEKYIINHGATVLIWKDGTKTIIKRCKEDEFNKRLAFLTAFFQHYSGMSKNKANKFLSSLVVEDEEIEGIKSKEKYKTDLSKLKVGDKVKVRNDLVVDKVYGEDLFVEDMSKFKGKIVTIENKIGEGLYMIHEDIYHNWTKEMFECKQPKHMKEENNG